MLLIAGVLWLLRPTAGFAAQNNESCNAQASFVKVGKLLVRKEYQSAKQVLSIFGTCPKLSPLEVFNVGWLYGRAHDFSQALRIFDSVPPDVPDPLTHGYAIALSHFELGNYQPAIDGLNELRSQGAFDAKCADLLGVSYSKLGRYQEAYPIMAENLQHNPTDPFAYFNLITLFVDAGETAKAAQVADSAVTAMPRSAEALVMRGSIRMSQGRLGDAHDDFSAAATISPHSPDPRFFMALSDYKQRKFVAGAEELKAAIRSGIVDSDLHYLLAECIIRMNSSSPSAALSELNRAIELNPKSVSARTLRGKMLLEAGHPRDALLDLRVARDLAPNPERDSRNATYLLARTYVALGKRDQANALFAQLSSQFISNNLDTLNELGDRRMKAVLHP
ncbi:MAG: tetratricopeptide repeat protein [Bryobacteraceae bacterium]